MESEIMTMPSLAMAASRYSVNRLEAEGLRQTLYDFQLYPTAGATQFTFFSLQQGQGLSSHPGNANATKGIWDTNMEASAQLPSPKSFLVTSIEMLFFAGSVATANTYTPQPPNVFNAAAAAAVINQLQDVNLILQTGELQFFIGSKSYLDEAPLQRFPPKTYYMLDGALTSNSATVGLTAAISGKAGGRPYYLDPPIFLVPNQNFRVTLNYPVVQATPSGFNGRIGCVLDGYLYRNSQ